MLDGAPFQSGSGATNPLPVATDSTTVRRMNESLVELLACPATGKSLLLHDAVSDAQGITSGELRTADGRQKYPIEGHIPRFVASESYAESFGREWNAFNRVQLDSANGTTISRTRFKALTGYEPEYFKGKRVLEAGCGSGRFLEVLAQAGAECFGIDMSTAVHVSRDNLAQHPNVHIVQADLTRLPFKPGTFDFMYSFGVLMCTPDTQASFRSLVPFLKPGGEIGIWVYGVRGPKWIPRPHQLFGLVARRLPHDSMMKALDAYVDVLLPLGRLPIVGKALRLAFPLSDLTEKREGDDGWDGGKAPPAELVRDWARLNTYDAFTPAMVRQHDFPEVEAWFRDAGLVDVRRRPTRTAVLGRKPQSS